MLQLCFLFVGLTVGTANKADPVSVRLGAKDPPCEGAVEIKSRSEWLPLCKDSLNVIVSGLICKSLHCGNAKEQSPVSTVTNSSVYVTIECPTAKSLSHCTLSHVPAGNCSALAMINCKEPPSLKLVGGGSPCAGRVELLLDKVWGSICDDGWDALDAQVTCRQLGCGLPLQVLGGSHFGSGPLKIHRDEMNCDGTEHFLWECPANESHDCLAGEHAGVICSEHQAVRLNGGPDGCSGRIEVFLKGVWGTVCNSHWDDEDSDMLCKYLECGSFVKKSIYNHSLSTYMAFICQQQVKSPWDCRIHDKNRNICQNEGAVGLLCNGSLVVESTTQQRETVTLPTPAIPALRLPLFYVCIGLLVLLLLLIPGFFLMIWKLRRRQGVPTATPAMVLTPMNEYNDSVPVRGKQPVPVQIPVVPQAVQVLQSDDDDYDFCSTPPVALSSFHDPALRRDVRQRGAGAEEQDCVGRQESHETHRSSSTSSEEQSWYENYRGQNQGYQELVRPPQSHASSSDYDDVSSNASCKGPKITSH
ncbi:T-cell differentiation antigen CD6 isoform X2 [Xenopus laevis]|uniref:T-cell differentiation antigen CD6 n=1 Tax=Xenopus laevis TaxID=8355 RepID=A0A8J1KUW5_XENLA|nr:T-cell differentiation antigen CD6 isoform X2 [Xenopus laevis]